MSNETAGDIRLTDPERKLLEYSQLFWLAARDVVWFAEASSSDLQEHMASRGGWIALINLSDTFGYACADAERLAPGQAHEVRAYYEEYGWSGVIAWVSVKRNQEPLEELKTPEYLKARAGLQNNQTIRKPKASSSPS